MNNNEIPIILTGTIIPNAANTVYADPEIRRLEYLAAIKYYSGFSQVVFLENSTYPIDQDQEFHQLTEAQICKMPVSTAVDRGKGYQEFEMIDSWLNQTALPPRRWIKVTGRYIYDNFNELYADCLRNQQARMIIDLCARSGKARTYLFCIDTEFYLDRIKGVYLECSDNSGQWIEDILFQRLKNVSYQDTSLFAADPVLTAYSGSTGLALGAGCFKRHARRNLRKLNLIFDKRYIWYSK